jgi:hypothetical protein
MMAIGRLTELVLSDWDGPLGIKRTTGLRTLCRGGDARFRRKLPPSRTCFGVAD